MTDDQTPLSTTLLETPGAASERSKGRQRQGGGGGQRTYVPLCFLWQLKARKRRVLYCMAAGGL
jgi:hypothetical protein